MSILKTRYYGIIIFLILFNLFTREAVAVEDGFDFAKKIEGRYFVVYYPRHLDITLLKQQLNIGPCDEIFLGKSSGGNTNSENELMDMLDTLFLKVCSILDMPLYSFEGKIKICPNSACLKQIYKNLFDKDIDNLTSFYVYDLNTIYINKDDFKVSVLGHEIAHMIVSHYFVVQTPMKIQEILAGYVEYQLRKTHR